MVLKPIRLGDYIIEDNNKNEGTVSEISLFYTKLLTVDNRTIVIPNSALTNNSLTNVTEQDRRLLEIKVGIAYHARSEKGKEIMEDLLISLDNRIAGEDVTVVVSSLEESSVVIMGAVHGTVRVILESPLVCHRRDQAALRCQGIEIPYNKLDVTVKRET